jgi:hypothetical protein
MEKWYIEFKHGRVSQPLTVAGGDERVQQLIQFLQLQDVQVVSRRSQLRSWVEALVVIDATHRTPCDFALVPARVLIYMCNTPIDGTVFLSQPFNLQSLLPKVTLPSAVVSWLAAPYDSALVTCGPELAGYAVSSLGLNFTQLSMASFLSLRNDGPTAVVVSASIPYFTSELRDRFQRMVKQHKRAIILQLPLSDRERIDQKPAWMAETYRELDESRQTFFIKHYYRVISGAEPEQRKPMVKEAGWDQFSPTVARMFTKPTIINV